MKQGKSFFVTGLALIFSLFLFSPSFALDWGKSELDNEKLAVNFYNEVKRGGYKIVTVEQLKEMLDKGGQVLMVDTMPFADSYQKQHIPGAVNFVFPIEEVTQLDPKQTAEFEKLLGPDKNKPLVFYCGFTKCTRSHNGAMWALKLGYKDVYRCPGGIKGWNDAGYTMEKAK
ncbi:MAG: rhodanese-like domain-containing protein [Syntrophobacteraceae bacterium]